MSINKLFAASLTALALLLSACSSVNKQTTAVTITSASLPNATIGVAYTQTLAASGGRAPYTWSLANGTTLPPGLTLASSTGVISGTATTFGVTAIAIQVADSSTPALTATQTFSMTVARVPLAITPVTLAGGTVGVSYTQTLSATGGLAPYTWSVSSGTLPPGLTLAASTGILSGTPTAAQTTTFTVKVTDAASSTATLALNFTAQAAPVPLSVTTTMLPSVPLGSAYTQTLAAAGGTPPYTWQVTTGKLPNGLSIVDSTGVISGTPTVAGTFNFTVQVTDYDAATATASLSITTQAVPLTGNALLQGQYFFKLDSFADDMSGQGHVFHEALVGSLVLDGAGNVSSGLSDRADDYFDNGTQPVTGTYVVNSDGRGTVTLNFGTSRTKVLALAAKAMVADPIGSVARRATLVETDTATDSEEGGKPYSTGFLQLEDPTAFADASLVGNRVFGISGDTFLYNTDINLPQQGGLSAAGLLSVGNDLTLGVASTMDIATNQAFDPNVALTGFLAEDTTPA
ncbi:MAG TPA: Ig domain-containing protein, partial [Acidobacteriaceae bacterium]